jgi:hypothetical protein
LSRLGQLLRCLGEGVCSKGLRALLGRVPFGVAVDDVAADTWEDEPFLSGAEVPDSRRVVLRPCGQMPAMHIRGVYALPKDRPPRGALPAEDLRRLWADLAGDDSVPGVRRPPSASQSG